MNGVYQIVSVPFFLHCWGKQEYGEWIVLFSIPTIVWSLEGGLSGVANNRMTVASATGDWELVNSIFQNVLLAQGILTILIIVASVGLVSFMNLHEALNFSKITGSETSMVFLLLIGFMLSSFYINLFRAGYRVMAQEHRGVMANNLIRFTDFCVTLLVVTVHGTPLLMAMVIMGNALLWSMLLYLDVRRVAPKLEFGVARASWQQSKSIIRDGLPLLAGQACTALFLQGYPLIINRILGASAVASFVTIRTISRTLLLLNQVIATSSAPEVSRSYGKKDWSVYFRLLKVMMISALSAGLVTILGLSILGPWIIGLWTGGKIEVDHPSMILFSISIALQGICGVGSVILVCSNMHHLYNYLYLVITALSLALAYLMMPYLGFIGAPGVMVIQDTVLLILMFALLRIKLKQLPFLECERIFNFDYYKVKLLTLFKK